MSNDMLSAFRTGAEIGGAFHKMDEAMHARAVQGKMDEILKATAERGGDITMLDPNMYSDRVGLEAMGRVAGQMAQTEAWKMKAMQNNAAQARQRFATFQQYFSDIEGAIKDGDQARTVALMSNMASQSGTPYRFMPTEDGGIRVGFVTPEGEVDKGTMTMTEAYDLLKPYATSQDRFVRDSVVYGMATQQENAEIMQDPRRWKQAMDRNGNQYTLVPQRIMRNGQLVSGFLVAGPGGQRNMTLDEVAQAGLAVGGRGMAGGMGGGNAAKQLEMYATDYAIDADGKQQKYVNPYKYDALSKLAAFGIDPAKGMAQWDSMVQQVTQANPNLTPQQISGIVYAQLLGLSPASAQGGEEGGAGKDALGAAIANNVGGGNNTPSPEVEERPRRKKITKNEVREGKAYTVTYDADGRELSAVPAQKSGEGMSSWVKRWRGFGESLRAGEEEYKKKAGRGLFSKEQLR